jgi:hypothetical protein
MVKNLAIYTLRKNRHTNPFAVLSKKSSGKYSLQRKPRAFGEFYNTSMKRSIKCTTNVELKRHQWAGLIIRTDYFHVCREVMLGCFRGRRSVEKRTGRWEVVVRSNATDLLQRRN